MPGDSSVKLRHVLAPSVSGGRLSDGSLLASWSAVRIDRSRILAAGQSRGVRPQSYILARTHSPARELAHTDPPILFVEYVSAMVTQGHVASPALPQGFNSARQCISGVCMLAVVLLLAVAPVQAFRTLNTVVPVNNKAQWDFVLADSMAKNQTVRAGLEPAVEVPVMVWRRQYPADPATLL